VTGRRAERPVLDGVRHGTRRAYVLGCGCEPCREAERTYHRAYEAGKRNHGQEPKAGPPQPSPAGPATAPACPSAPACRSATPRPAAPRPPRRALARTPTAAQRRAFQGSTWDPAKAEAARRHRPRVPLTDAERQVLAELLRAW
jgi:hypothetical protein